ncbi:armadillo-type protein [Xylariomycetidae sp. FL2044]|nr:armadillo-type protein [Xylariomycetidae sp. FL2044]
MASFENRRPVSTIESGSDRPQQHQRSNANVLKSFMHKRNNSEGIALPAAPLVSPTDLNLGPKPPLDMGIPNFSRPSALGELQHNQIGGAPRSPTKPYERPSAPTSPSKNVFSALTLKSSAVKDAEKLSKLAKQNDDVPPVRPDRPKKTKSATNLVALLSRPKSLKNLHKLASEDEIRSRKDKENRTPTTSEETSRPPIYAQFSSGALEQQNREAFKNDVAGSPFDSNGSSTGSGYSTKLRPQSYDAYSSTRLGNVKGNQAASGGGAIPSSKTQRGLKLFTNGTNSKGNASMLEVSEPKLEPQDIDRHLEAMLDRRNIPEHQRYKMRSLADTIKMEFIRQDWAESRGVNNARPDSHDSDSSMTGAQEMPDSKSKKTRGRTFTLSRNSGKKSESTSPVKKPKGEGTIGRHFRSRSTESVASDRPSSAGSNSGSGILSKMKLQLGPSDYVNYLRKVQKPEVVEVGKLHKLRLLLRNETVAWTEEFIRQGGMQEIVGLLHRIMDVEWREEHEDALLHENLLCLKALCTTALALQYLHSIQATLFPALLHMLFDPEKKGPSEFTTRNIITSVLFTYIQSASPQDRPIRAKTVLGHLRDPEPKEEERPLGFVLDMRRERPYRIWCKEAIGVTKEVFWIFLHHLNVVYLPRDKELKEGFGPSGIDAATYMQTHFPQERPPVPAAPYVGGVEWDATNYLASHLDILNAILACTPTVAERNSLRELFRISGWERCMGGSLRLCKEKFYPGVHDALRTWVGAAVEDGWDVRDVRYGPPAEPKSPSKKKNVAGGVNQAKQEKEAPPKIDFPIVNVKTSDDWLS